MNETIWENIRQKTFPWRALLYLVTPDETSPKSLDDAPDYVDRVHKTYITVY